MKALSIRGPWWWFILHATPPKDYENRDWDDAYAAAQLTRCPEGSNFLIHSSSGMSEREFTDACKFAVDCGVRVLPRFEEVKKRNGGIVGMVRHGGIVRASRSPWFSGGRLAIRLLEPYPVPFQRCKGALGFFDPVLGDAA